MNLLLQKNHCKYLPDIQHITKTEPIIVMLLTIAIRCLLFQIKSSMRDCPLNALLTYQLSMQTVLGSKAIYKIQNA